MSPASGCDIFTSNIQPVFGHQRTGITASLHYASVLSTPKRGSPTIQGRSCKHEWFSGVGHGAQKWVLEHGQDRLPAMIWASLRKFTVCQAIGPNGVLEDWKPHLAASTQREWWWHEVQPTQPEKESTARVAEATTGHTLGKPPSRLPQTPNLVSFPVVC